MNDNLGTDTLIQKIIQWAQDRDDVRAVLLTSTRAILGEAINKFSDYDVILLVRDIYVYYEDEYWLQDFGDVLVIYRDPIRLDFGLERFAYITQYENGLKIDFTIWPVEIIPRIVEMGDLPDYLDVGYVVLLDKDHLTGGLKPPTFQSYIPIPPSEDEYQELVREFFHESTYVAKHLVREDLIPAKYNFDYRMKHVNLVKLLQWRIEIEHNWSVKTGAYGKGLKKYLGAHIWSLLEDTYVGAGSEENWDALFKTIELFRRVAIEVAESLGHEYLHDLDQRVTIYLRKVKALNRSSGIV